MHIKYLKTSKLKCFTEYSVIFSLKINLNRIQLYTEELFLVVYNCKIVNVYICAIKIIHEITTY